VLFRSIHASDYFEPLTFEFDTKVLQASVLETTPPTLIKPSDLPTFFTLTPQSVQFPTFPLNTNDSIQISILLEGKGILKARGRLDQGTIVELEREKLNITGIIQTTAGVAAGAATLTALIAFALAAGEGAGIRTGAGGSTISILATIATIVAIAVGLFWLYRWNIRR